MREKMVFFDIDGTLIDESTGRIPDSTKEALHQLRKNGVHTGIATGRAPFMFAHLLKELEMDSFISFNGSYVVFKGEVIYKATLDVERLKELEKLAVQSEHPLVFLDHAKATTNNEYADVVYESTKHLLTEYPSFDETYYHSNDVYQALLFCDEEFEQPYRNDYKGTFDFIRWHHHAIDVMPFGGSKAKGIEELLKRTTIKREDTFSFGDALNDIEMLQSSGMGIAMGNGRPEAKKAAHYVTKPVGEDGIWHGLKHAGLI
ncbi:Cof-type HAD-IIB family hydrolase [Fictibacillus sp. WQ 8-8]|uniref:Cof-type HAD-IIB family hydrolase n=1 Tax=unclassified Fictibacillus TaxID=2644029 RepID=UPI000782DE67|nr:MULTISPECIES: Cof-type HAD-IIB family hydrolase [unclassified Fictibacillus]MCQ6265396.1 Cof-type HAD-IIB family hydrolase [Fictibacillus sp. WQ 8-8]MED2973705.1 Cof-type HAD-IIB family hydrolase [Fictibacillus sp. B-59209]